MWNLKNRLDKPWYLYIVCCSDNTLYTGITTDIIMRIQTHNEGKGAKYTQGRTPVYLQYSEKHETKSSALKREIQIKKLKKKQKLGLINAKKD